MCSGSPRSMINQDARKRKRIMCVQANEASVSLISLSLSLLALDSLHASWPEVNCPVTKGFLLLLFFIFSLYLASLTRAPTANHSVNRHTY